MKSQRYGRSHPRSGFTPQEDCLLIDLVAQFGNDSWSTIASYMEKRNARQCKDRYNSYLSPTINKGPFTEEEDDLLRKKYNEIGPKWVKISKFFPNRTDISVKCRWAVLNRRDLKASEKSGNIHSKTQKSKNTKKCNFDSISDNYSSSPVDSDFVFEKDDSFIITKSKDGLNKRQKKNKNTISNGYHSTMTLRKRNRKHFAYNESDDENFDIDFDEIMQSKDQNTDEKEPNSSFSTVSTPPSLSSTDDDNENSPKSTIDNQLTFSSEENANGAPYNEIISQTFPSENSFPQSHSKFTSETNTKNTNQSETTFSINPSSLFDIFSFYYKDGEEMFSEYHTPAFPNQMMNMGINRNENFNQFNQNKGFGFNNLNNGNYINNFQSNIINNPFIQDRNASSFASSLNEPNKNFGFNDQKKEFKPEEEIFNDELNWDICWDVQCSC